MENLAYPCIVAINQGCARSFKMPTVIILDASMSMLRPSCPPSAHPCVTTDSEEGITGGAGTPDSFLDVAKGVVGALLYQLEMRCFRMESVAALSYSSTCEPVCGFTRDLGEVRAKVAAVEVRDCSKVAAGLAGAMALVFEQWSSAVACNLILVTDGQGLDSVHEVASVLPLGFPASLNVVCLDCRNRTHDSWKTLVEKSGAVPRLSGVHLVGPNPDEALTTVQKLCDLLYSPFEGDLTFGCPTNPDMSCRVNLFPSPPTSFKDVQDFREVEVRVGPELAVKGVLTLADVASPPVVSRHLVIAAGKDDEKNAQLPSLCAFLHGALKVEGLCALVQVAKAQPGTCNWFGILFSHSDTKKKSCLMLALFRPGDCPVPWLGNLRHLGPAVTVGEDGGFRTLGAAPKEFPVVASGHRPSYSCSPVTWLLHSYIQTDVQKILRHARKMPDKTSHFYKDMNRLKRGALSFGFTELLDRMVDIFNREIELMPPNAHPECCYQLQHVVAELRSRRAMKIDHVLTPKTRD